jgi:hypothetical protein
MITYLYVKTHSVTGLKYLGKTTKQDPHNYPGSGTYWKRHLRLHGYDYTTEILKECTSNEDVRTWGLYYSELWNVAVSDEWANLISESGDGGGDYTRTPESIEKMIATKLINDSLKQTPESIEKMLTTKLSRGTNSGSLEIIAKSNATKKANGGYKHSAESIAKILATKLVRGNINSQTPETIAKSNATKLTRGTNKRSQESIAKQKATCAKNKAARDLANR